ncbi:hypothetical protein A1O3_06768 [Capronia epimyces CBS 606.96]|uniref:histidine kinase n=1 Tax=Capronia epimyces CBS 606.96 TaxID=1182542 RepID=W9Y147_9EURO|nr:uncharacterized protein A1O3_06768 [Capronia epimyces CBS 606.96]EXJ82951.1 hypothetical protein A1O3_06768 [Capronia epimyces CBS 606.96]
MAREGAREREMHRYYKPWLETFIPTGLKPTLCLPPENLVEQDCPRSCRDKALTAFAQLGCLRLNVKRGVVTLLDSSKQYIIAEATRSLSLLDDSQHAPEDELWFGNSYIERDIGVSSDAMYPGSYIAHGPDGSYTAAALVVDDLAVHEKYKTRDYAGHGISFYCGVPITTKLGHVIGVYSVTDDKPRSGLLPAELRFMTDMAVIVIQHLEVVKNDRARARGERLIQSIGTFIEGDVTEKASQINPPFHSQPTPSIAQSAVQWDGGCLDAPTLPSDGKHSKANRPVNGDANLALGQAEPPETQASALETHDYKADRRAISSERQKLEKPGTAQEAAVHPEARRLEERKRAAALKEKALSDSLHVFDRAAAILRVCLSVDGVVYLNASSANLSSGSSMQDLDSAVSMVRHSKPTNRRVDNQKTEHSSRSSSAEDGLRESTAQESSDSNSSTAAASNNDSSYPPTTDQRCEVLGISQLGPDKAVKISEQTLRRSVRRHPHGSCFIYDQHGNPASSDETSDSASASTIPTKQAQKDQSLRETRHLPTTKALLKAFPGARKIVFLPLWDFAAGRWHSGMVLWTNDVNRLTNIQDDLSYLKAYNNAVMNEVNRIDLALSDTAKATFLANISHELRSPLHGILGSIEFLNDTALDDFQSSMVLAVETCGKTLLDTLNHVLDYAKINRLSKNGPLHPRSRAIHGHVQPSSSDSSLTDDFDMAVVVEEAIEAVYAGQVFHSANADKLSAKGRGGQTAANRAMQSRKAARKDLSQVSAASTSQVRLTLNIDNLANWKVRSQPGAIRRIVMNILGNALKYTSQGSINVVLEADESQEKSSSNLHVVLKVTDTGRGMSGEFMKNHAFAAFAQEDSLATGTGLGLSIVRQIVDSLKGNIDLSSEKEVGTEIRIWLRLPKSQKEEDDDTEKNTVAEVRELTKGLEMCIIMPRPEKTEGAREARTLRPMPTVEESLRDLIAQWFSMKVHISPNMEGDPPNFFVYPEPPPIDYLLDQHGRTKTSQEIPVIVLCTNAFEAASLRSHGIHRLTEIGRIIEVIAQPSGPQKLAKVLQRCMRRMKLLGDSESPRSTGPTPLSIKPQGASSSATVAPAQAVKTQGYYPGREPRDDTSMSDHEPAASAVPKPSNNNRCSSQADVELPVRLKGEGPRVLVVDDNSINLHLLVTFVKKTNHPHESAMDGEQALEAYRKGVLDDGGKYTFKYILMDISMPVMNGIMATKEIRRFEKEQRVRTPAIIIALTGLGSESAQNEAYQAGFDHFLSKPIVSFPASSRCDFLAVVIDNLADIGLVSLQRFKDLQKLLL